MTLWREVQARGYAGGGQMVQHWVAERRSKRASTTARKWLQSAPTGTPPAATLDGAAALPSPKQLAWLLVQPPAALRPLDAAAVERVEQDREAALVASLARRFSALGKLNTQRRARYASLSTACRSSPDGRVPRRCWENERRRVPARRGRSLPLRHPHRADRQRHGPGRAVGWTWQTCRRTATDQPGDTSARTSSTASATSMASSTGSPSHTIPVGPKDVACTAPRRLGPTAKPSG